MTNQNNISVKENMSVVIGKDEMNLAEFPFTLLSRRAKVGQNTIEVSQQVRDPRGRIVKQEWVVTGGDKYGLPLAVDEDVYIALMQLYEETDFKEKRVFFSRYQILSMIGKETSKKGYDRIEGALNRLVSVTIVSKNAFWDNNAKRYVSKIFHLFESADLYEEMPGRKKSDQQALPLSNVVMSEFLFDSIKAGYIKNLNTRLYFSLRTPLSKRLYRYLDKKKYQKSIFEIELLKLAALLPIQDKYPSQIRRRLDRVHAELMEKGFLKSVSYEKTKDRDKEKVIYTFPQMFLTGGKKGEVTTSLKQKLIERRIAAPVAAKLVENYPDQRIEKQIEVFDWLVEKNSHSLGKNPPGFLRKAIEDNYATPSEYINEMGQRERKKAENAKKAEAERKRQAAIEDELANWDKITPKKRVEGFINFWIQGERLNKGEPPTPEEIEAKRREQIAALPQTEEARRQYLDLEHTIEKYL